MGNPPGGPYGPGGPWQPQGHLPGYHLPGTLTPIGAVVAYMQSQAQAPPIMASPVGAPRAEPEASPWDNPALPAIATWPAPDQAAARPPAARPPMGQPPPMGQQPPVGPRHGRAAAAPDSGWVIGRLGWLAATIACLVVPFLLVYHLYPAALDLNYATGSPFFLSVLFSLWNISVLAYGLYRVFRRRR